MSALPVSTVEQLEELLSRPSAADIDAARQLGGDLMILGVGGKMGPTLALRARRAFDVAGVRAKVWGVARFSEPGLRQRLEAGGVECLTADLTDRAALAALPDCPHIIHAAGRKFGSTADPSLTWAMNVLVPALVAERFAASRIVAFSSGNVYPLRPIATGGATEDDAPLPVGEYAWTGLGRERMFEYQSRRLEIPVILLRLNYAIDLRYGVLLDIGSKVYAGQPVDLTMGAVNVIWQGDANSVALRAFPLAATPAAVLNLTGPETLSVRRIAEAFGRAFHRPPVFTGAEAPDALLNDAARCHQHFGYPAITPAQMIEWTARWIESGGVTLAKPTHFQTRDGRF